MNKMKFNILVTGCGGDIGQSIGKILLDSKIIDNLYGIDISDKTPAKFIFPNFMVGLPVCHPSYLKSLKRLIKINKIDLLIPISEPELRFFSENKIFDRLGKSKIITCSDLALEIGFDKFKTIHFLENNNLPFPKTFKANKIKNLDKFPYVLKSSRGSGSKNVHLIKNFEDFSILNKINIDDYIVQEYISEKEGEYTCGLFRNSEGEIRSIIFKRELTGGYSSYGEVIENDRISNLLIKLAEKLNLIGSINVQLRLDNGIPKIFEINPRFSSTVYFRHLFGFEDLIWSIQDALGQPLSDNRRNIAGSKFYKGFQEYITKEKR